MAPAARSSRATSATAWSAARGSPRRGWIRSPARAGRGGRARGDRGARSRLGLAPVPRRWRSAARGWRPVAATAVLAFGALLGATAVPGPDSAVAGRVYVAGSSTPAVAAAADAATTDDTSSSTTGSGDATPPRWTRQRTRRRALPADTAAPAPAPATSTPTDSGDGTTTPAGTTKPAATSPAPVKHAWVNRCDTFSTGGAPTASAAQAQTTPPATAGGLADAGTVLPAYASVTKGSLANAVTLISGLDATAAQQQNCATYSAVEPWDGLGQDRSRDR